VDARVRARGAVDGVALAKELAEGIFQRALTVLEPGCFCHPRKAAPS